MPKIWIMSVGVDRYGHEHKDRREELDGKSIHCWSVPSTSHIDDLVLFYYTSPEKCVKSIFKITGKITPDNPEGWTKRNKDWFARIERITETKHIAPIKYEEIMQDKFLKNSQFVKINLTGRSEVKPEYWKRLYDLLLQRNPNLGKKLTEYHPNKI
jgi:hypothetical protein